MLASLTIRLNPADDVVIARQQLIAGTILADEGVVIRSGGGIQQCGRDIFSYSSNLFW